MLRLRSFSLVLLGTLVVASVWAQPGPFNLAEQRVLLALQRYMESPELHRELVLKPEQVKRWRDTRQKHLATRDTTPVKDYDVQAANKALEAALLEGLTPEQKTRLRQIAIQRILRGNLFPREGLELRKGTVLLVTLSRYPELTAALKLDEDQKKLLERFREEQKRGRDGSGGGRGGFGRFGPGGLSVHLSVAQQATLRSLTGKPFQVDPNPGFDDRVGAADSLRRASWDEYGRYDQVIHVKDVQKELKLTEEQSKQLRAMREADSKGTYTDYDLKLSPAQQREAQAKKDQERRQAVDKILTPEQIKRLGQILQLRELTISLFHPASEMGTKLKVTPEQREMYSKAERETLLALKKTFDKNESIETITKLIEALADRESAYEKKLLTPAQQKQLFDAIGEEYKGGWNVEPLDGWRPDGTSTTTALQRDFGLYTTQLSVTQNYPGVVAELKLTPEQMAKLGAAHWENVKGTGVFGPIREDLVRKRSESIEKTLRDVLTKEQFQRLGELTLQSRLAARTTEASPFGLSRPAVGLPGVAAAIKLTDEQKKRLFAGELEDKVLTDAQKKQLQTLAGAKADVASLFKSERFRRVPGSGDQYGLYRDEDRVLVNYPGVQKELKLTAEQVKNLRLDPEASVGLSASLILRTEFGANPSMRVKLFKDNSDRVEKWLREHLTAEQRERYRQLLLQRDLAPRPDLPSRFLGPSPATARPGVADALKLTPEQRKKIADGTPEKDVLNAEQQRQLVALAGKKVESIAEIFRLPGFEDPRARPFARPNELVVMILQGSPAVQTLPDLTDALRDRLAAEANRLTLQSLGGGDTAEQEKKLLGLLSESQQTALRRVLLSNTAALSLPSLLNHPTVRKELALSDEALKKLTVPEEVDRWRELLEKLQNRTNSSPLMEWEELHTNAVLKVRERYDTQLLSVLSREQREKLDALLDQPYAKVSKAPILPETGSRRGRGGRGAPWGSGGFPGGPD